MARMITDKDARVVAIAPGFCNTRMAMAMPSKVLDRIKARIPLGRLGEPDEIGYSVVYLFENDYFNGRVLEVEGGLRL
ncbi:MAG: SDR family oxidoreductase [Nitrococcus mobilis]|nr:SDR family oxidoreductase [Nitrococcus mobilis]